MRDAEGLAWETLLYDVDERGRGDRAEPAQAAEHDRAATARGVPAAIDDAALDAAVKVIVVRAAGRAFGAGYDFREGFHHWDA
jgi:hypothetical protein